MGKDRRLYIEVTLDIFNNPKLAALPTDGKLLYIASLIVARRDLTDGAIRPQVAVHEAGIDTRRGGRLTKLLRDQGLYHGSDHTCDRCKQPPSVEGWVQIHDYEQHQQTRAEVDGLQKVRSEAGRVGAAARWGGKRRSKSHGKSDGKSHRTDDVSPMANRWQSQSESKNYLSVSSNSTGGTPADHETDDELSTDDDGSADGEAAAKRREWTRNAAIEDITRRLDCDWDHAVRVALDLEAQSNGPIRDHAAYFAAAIGEAAAAGRLDELRPTPTPQLDRCDRCGTRHVSESPCAGPAGNTSGLDDARAALAAAKRSNETRGPNVPDEPEDPWA